MVGLLRGALLAGFCAACVTSADPDELALVAQRFPLGATLVEVRAAASDHCDRVTVNEYSTAEAAPYHEQTQVDCYGYQWRGAPRKIEFLVNEGELGFYWLMFDAGESDAVGAELRARLGAARCANADYPAIHLARGVALRREPAEILVAKPDDFRAITGGCPQRYGRL